MRHPIALGVLAALALAAPASASSWMTYQQLHARECATLQHIATRQHGITLGCHIYGKHQLVTRTKIDIPLTIAAPFSGYTEQTYAASFIPHYGIYWTTVSPVSAHIFSDQP